MPAARNDRRLPPFLGQPRDRTKHARISQLLRMRRDANDRSYHDPTVGSSIRVREVYLQVSSARSRLTLFQSINGQGGGGEKRGIASGGQKLPTADLARTQTGTADRNAKGNTVTMARGSTKKVLRSRDRALPLGLDLKGYVLAAERVQRRAPAHLPGICCLPDQAAYRSKQIARDIVTY